jgi:hypothetical protein
MKAGAEVSYVSNVLGDNFDDHSGSAFTALAAKQLLRKKAPGGNGVVDRGK